MKARSDKRPLETEVERLGDGRAAVFLREDIVEQDAPQNDMTDQADQGPPRKEFAYNEYRVETEWTDDLLDRVKRFRFDWLAAAINGENRESEPDATDLLKQRQDDADAYILDLDFRTTLLENGIERSDLL